MKRFNDYTDERYKGYCLHCAARLGRMRQTRDHVPSKVLLNRPLPDNVHVVDICEKCNNGFSADEEYFAAFLGAAMFGGVDPRPDMFEGARRALRGNLKLAKEIAERVERFTDEDGISRLTWYPDFERVRSVVVKNARGHAFHELGQPCQDEPSEVFIRPLISTEEKKLADFLLVDHGSAWPEVGSRLLQRLYTGVDMADGWIIVQPDVYVYTVLEDDGVIVRSIIREYLLTEVRWY